MTNNAHSMTSALHQYVWHGDHTLPNGEYELFLATGPELLTKQVDPVNLSKTVIKPDGTKYALVLKNLEDRRTTNVGTYYSTARFKDHLPYFKVVVDQDFPSDLFSYESKKRSTGEAQSLGIIHGSDLKRFQELFDKQESMSSGLFVLGLLYRLVEEGMIERLSKELVLRLLASVPTRYDAVFGDGGGQGTIDALAFKGVDRPFV